MWPQGHVLSRHCLQDVFSGKVAGLSEINRGVVKKRTQRGLLGAWLDGSGRSFLLVPFRHLVPGSGFPDFDGAISAAGDDPLSIGGEPRKTPNRYVLQ